MPLGFARLVIQYNTIQYNHIHAYREYSDSWIVYATVFTWLVLAALLLYCAWDLIQACGRQVFFSWETAVVAIAVGHIAEDLELEDLDA